MRDTGGEDPTPDRNGLREWRHRVTPMPPGFADEARRVIRAAVDDARAGAAAGRDARQAAWDAARDEAWSAMTREPETLPEPDEE